jgi:glycosyltransferase involved in cell wall biosynthesis
VNTPVVSVIIPAYNAATTLGAAIASITRQTTVPLEIIVIDDGSTDDTAAVCASCGTEVRYISQPNSGVAVARNHGVRVASCALIAFLDADDEWAPDSLSTLSTALHAHPTWAGVQGRTAAFRQATGALGADGASGAPWYGPFLSSTLIRQSAFHAIGAFDPTLRLAEDLDWFIRAREAGQVIGQVDATTLYYRLHANSLTRGLDPQQKNLLLVLKRSLARRRALSGESIAS